MKKQSYLKDLLTVGFALFAMFFGAGNLIFPPHLGLYCGGQWWLGFLIYFLADVGLGFLAVLALVKLDGRVDMVAEPLGRGPSVALSTAVISVLGPLLVIPRTAATTYELGVIPLFGIESSRVSLVILSVVFYAIVILLTIRPGKVVDIVGKILTPILLVSLLVLIIKGAVDPEAAVGPVLTESVFQEGLYVCLHLGYRKHRSAQRVFVVALAVDDVAAAVCHIVHPGFSRTVDAAVPVDQVIGTVLLLDQPQPTSVVRRHSRDGRLLDDRLLRRGHREALSRNKTQAQDQCQTKAQDAFVHGLPSFE